MTSARVFGVEAVIRKCGCKRMLCESFLSVSWIANRRSPSFHLGSFRTPHARYRVNEPLVVKGPILTAEFRTCSARYPFAAMKETKTLVSASMNSSPRTSSEPSGVGIKKLPPKLSPDYQELVLMCLRSTSALPSLSSGIFRGPASVFPNRFSNCLETVRGF